MSKISTVKTVEVTVSMIRKCKNSALFVLFKDNFNISDVRRFCITSELEHYPLTAYL